MNNVLLTNSFRFIVLALVQVFILRNVVATGGAFWANFQLIIYPVFVMLLPFRTPRVLILGLAFGMGLFVDAFYNSLGIHASACVFMAYLRFFVLDWLEPKGGYNNDYSPTKQRLGLGWFMGYSAILLFGYLLWYFSVEAFTFVFWKDILAKTSGSFIISYIIILIMQFIFNPKE